MTHLYNYKNRNNSRGSPDTNTPSMSHVVPARMILIMSRIQKSEAEACNLLNSPPRLSSAHGLFNLSSLRRCFSQLIKEKEKEQAQAQCSHNQKCMYLSSNPPRAERQNHPLQSNNNNASSSKSCCLNSHTDYNAYAWLTLERVSKR